MKVLKKKLKKVHGAKKFFYFLSILLYIATFAYFTLGILKLKGIETLIRYIIIGFFAVWLIIYILCGLITMISKKTKTFIFITVLTLLFCPVFTFASYYINKVYGSLSTINNENLTYTTNLIALKNTNFNSNLSIGMIETESDIEGNILAKKLIEKENLSNKIEVYEDYQSMIHDLYKGRIGACFVSNNYAINFSGEEYDYTDENGNSTSISEVVKVLFTYSEERKNQDTATLNTDKNKKLTEPFTVLVMGVDSTINGLTANQAFNGDTLIMVTFNPNTLTATMFSIPRDMYVPIACNHNRYAKINSSAAYGSSCVINTVQQLTGIDIDYYLKINFTGVVNLVDALGGVTVDVEEPDFARNGKYNCGENRLCEQNSLRKFGDNLIYIDAGVQTLNGEQALAYARNRHQYATSDIARNQHQQQIIEAMAKKLKDINSLNQVENILNTVSNNLETNMTPEQILSFYSVGKDMLANSSGNSLSIKKTHLAYYNLNPYIPRSGRKTSALGYYPQSLEAITKLMRINLELESETPTKTFSISYNEDYTTPIVGKGLTGGAKLALVDNLVGKTQYEANVWCQTNGVNCMFETKTDSAPAGIIFEQSVHEDVLVKAINSITFYISDGRGVKPEDPIENPENPENPEDPGENPETPENPENPGENPEKPENPENPGENPGGEEVVIPGGPEE